MSDCDSTTTAAAVVTDGRLFLGADVHVRNTYFSVSDAAGQTVKRGRVGNTLGEFAEFLVGGPAAGGSHAPPGCDGPLTSTDAKWGNPVLRGSRRARRNGREAPACLALSR